MALQFVFGSAGSGKSTFLYDMMVKEAAEHRDKQYFILVPDQFTLETQKTLVEKSGGSGILNIDVLSFHRLAFRVFEQLPAKERTILEDMGKTMLLRKVFSEQKDRLTYFKKGIDKPGFLDECKSFLCELEQYGICGEEQFGKLSELGCKFDDIRLIYECFKEKMGDVYMMAEELIVQLTDIVHEMEGIRGSVICLDGFTGFTPTQYGLIERLLALCEDLYVTVATDSTGKRRHIFQISEETVRTLTRMANRIPVEVRPPVMTGRGEEKRPYRFSEGGELAFLEKNLFCYPAGVWPEPTEELGLYIGKKPQDEAAYVARSIWWLTAKKGYGFEDIAVIAGDMTAYEQVLSREFSKMGIRYFLDAKKNIGANWIAEMIQAVLEMYLTNMDYESTFRFLRCGLSPLSRDEADLFENYVLATGKRGFSAYEKEWEHEIAKISLEEVNAMRAKVCDCLRELFTELGGGKKTVAQFTKALYGFLVRQDVYHNMLAQSEVFARSGEDMLAKEYESVYAVVVALLDEMVELMGDEVVSIEEYRKILAAGISEGLVGFIPPQPDQVVVGDIRRTRLKDVKVLFFVGFSDDMIPGGMQAPGIVNTRERKKIEQMGIALAPSGTKKAANDLFYLYLIFTKPSERLFFTYSESGGDSKGRQESYVLTKIRKIFPKIKIETDENTENRTEALLGTDRGLSFLLSGFVSEEIRTGEEKETWWELWSYYKKRKDMAWLRRALDASIAVKKEGKLSAQALEYLYGDELYGSITKLEQFAKCPFAYFILYGLALRERQEYTVAAPDFGNVVHHTLQVLSDRMREKDLRWRDLEEGQIETLVDACVEEVTGGYRDVLFCQSKRIEYMITRIKRMMNRTVWAISEQMRRGAFEQEYCEAGFSYHDDLPSMKISLDGEKKLMFSGVIDRIDTYEDDENVYVKVVDYKTGGVKFSMSSVFHGLQMQLVLYMAAAMDMEQKKHPDKKIVPAGMLYYYVKDPVIRMEHEEEADGLAEKMLAEYRCDGYVNQSTDVLQKFDSVFGVNGYLESGVKSACIPVSVTTKGDFGRFSKIMDGEQWGTVMAHTLDVAAGFGNEIMEGNIEVSPYRMGNETGCDYCGLRGVCGMERSEMAKRCRELDDREGSL